MNKLLVFTMCLTSLLMVGCDENYSRDVLVSSTTMHINTTESVSVKTFNGFRLTNYELTEDKNGGYKVVLNFNKLFD